MRSKVADKWSDWLITSTTNLDSHKYIVFVDATQDTESGYEAYYHKLMYIEVYAFKDTEHEEFKTMVSDMAVSGDNFSFYTLGPKGNFKIEVVVEE